MKDQLALYRLDQATFDQAQHMDFVEGGEVASFLERRGRFVAELFLERVSSARALIEGLWAIFGGGLRGLVGRDAQPLGPPGPHTFCSCLPPDQLSLMGKALFQAQRAVGKERDPDPQIAEQARRLAELANHLKIGPAMAAALRDLSEFLEQGRAGQGTLIVVYSG